MRLANKFPEKTPLKGPANDVDPREETDAEIIDLAQRNAFPAVARPGGGKSDALGMVAGLAIIAGLGAVTLWSMNSARLDPQPEGVGSDQVAPPQQAQNAPTPAPFEGEPDYSAVESQGFETYPDPAPAPIMSNDPMAQTEPRAERYNSPTVVFDAGTARDLAGAPGVEGAGDAAQNAPAGRGEASDFASRVGGVGGAPARATAMTNPSTTVTQGTLIPAILETAIDTNVPGFVRAVVSQDVRSFDGKRTLVPRSSRLIGQYQSGMQNGQRRAYVIWTRLIRPDGASVNLASPAIGFDGTTGLAGKVSGNGFFKRFGSAMLLSVVGGLGQLATGGAGVILGGAGNSAAATAAEQDGQRGPTVRVRQGEPIRIFTARDLDFSTVS
ncbi:type VI secretion protein [Erythrobacter litoralis]|uniref:TrbI/VirB10 family protein n=1 Tax=Erythrobacter litoralis TaxID=39960 RepID=UPI002435F354|nr:TrbI/VirB10 family protein [Erythrobacter litoralis]MDG6077779.1 type VI secretion protein [Erythrobacter litoralis]